jgi:hypothetical protein
VSQLYVADGGERMDFERGAIVVRDGVAVIMPR